MNNYPCNYYVGYGYAKGKGVEMNTRRALMYFEKGVANGEAICCFELAYSFDTGLMGLDVDKAEARRYYTLIFVRCPNGKLAGGLLEHAKKWLRDNGADETVL